MISCLLSRINHTNARIIFVVLLLLATAPLQADGFGGSINVNTPPEKPTQPNQNDPDGCTDKPVHLLTGAEIHSETDLVMKGLFPLRLSRTYSSQSHYDSPLGYGWAFSHDRRLFEYPDGSVSIRFSCGWHDRYVFTGGRYQTPKNGLEGSLVENADGTFERTYSDNRKDFYDAEGRLIAIQDPRGHRQEYTYDPVGKLPLTGTSPFSVNPTTPMVVAYTYRVTRIAERAADGQLTGNHIDFAYDPNTGRLDTATTSDGRTIRYEHDIVATNLTTGNLLKVVGLEGITSTYMYDDPRDAHNLTSIQQGTGTTPVVNRYDALDRVQQQTYGQQISVFDYRISLFETAITRKVFDDSGVLRHRGETVYTFNEEGYVSEILDPLGNKKVITRDGLNHIEREEFWTNNGTLSAPDLVLSRAVNYRFDAAGNKRREAVYLGNGHSIIRNWSYDHGWVDSYEIYSTDDGKQVFRTEFTFYRDASNIPTNLHKIKRQRTNGSFQITTLTHDAKNRLKTIQYPDGHKLQVLYEAGSLYPTQVYHEIAAAPSPYKRVRLGYDTYGNINNFWDGRDNLIQAVYDEQGRITDYTNPLNEKTLITYDDARLDLIEFGRTAAGGEGQVYKLRYDAKNQISQVQRKDAGSALQTWWTYTYDSEGNVLSATDAEGRAWRYTYDVLNRFETFQDTDNNTWRWQYDMLGNATSVIDAKNQETRYTYDGAGRLTQKKQLAASPVLVTRYGYNALGRITTVSDPKDQTTTYQYDNLARLSKVIQPLNQQVQYIYDLRNRLDYLINARGQKIDLAYEAWGPVNGIQYFADATTSTVDRTVFYQYDYNGNLTHATDTAVQASLLYQYSYDSLNRPDIVTAYSFAGKNRQLDHDYDRYGNRSQLKVSDWDGSAWVQDFAHQYQYNKLDQLASATFGASPIRFDYYKNDRTKQIAFPSGVSDNFTYHANGPLHWVEIANSGGPIEKISYTYDKLLNVKDYTDADGLHSFEYDGISQLTKATHPAGIGLPTVEDFAYDPAGNREDLANVATYDYDSNNRITTAQGQTYSYDDSGNLSHRSDGATFTYDHDNRLSTFTKGATNATYQYDPFGRRIKKTVNGTATTFLWDGIDLIAEYNNTGVRTKRYAYTEQAYAPLQVEDGNGIYDVHLDELGTPRLLTDQSQNVVWRSKLQAFGQAVINEDVDANATTVTLNVRYPGQYYDAESGLHYNFYRYYDPETGRYITQDPIGQNGGLNLYAYVLNNPVNFIDPYGLNPVAGAIGGGTIAGPPGAVIGGVIGFGIGLYLGDRMFNEDGSSDGDYPANPDNWNPPDGWVETPAGEKTGGKHRQWKGPDGKWRRWDREGRKGGKGRGSHWHDSDRPGEHIDPDQCK